MYKLVFAAFVVTAGTLPIEDTPEVAAAKAAFKAAYEDAIAGGLANKQAPQIGFKYLPDTADVAKAKANFQAVFDDVLSGGLSKKQVTQISSEYLADDNAVTEAKANFQAVFNNAIEGSLGIKEAPQVNTENTADVEVNSPFQLVLDDEFASDFDINMASNRTQDNLLTIPLQEPAIPAPLSYLTNASTTAINDINNDVFDDTVAEVKAKLQALSDDTTEGTLDTKEAPQVNAENTPVVQENSTFVLIPDNELDNDTNKASNHTQDNPLSTPLQEPAVPAPLSNLDNATTTTTIRTTTVADVKAKIQVVFDDATDGSLNTKEAPQVNTENTSVVQENSTFQLVLDNEVDSSFGTNKASNHTQDSILSTPLQETPVPAPLSNLSNASTEAIIDNNKEVSNDTVADEKANLQAMFDDTIEGSLSTKDAQKEITENTTVVQVDSTFQLVQDDELDSNSDTNLDTNHTQDSILPTPLPETSVLIDATTTAIIDNTKDIFNDTVADEKANFQAQDSHLSTTLQETPVPAPVSDLTNATTTTINDNNKDVLSDTVADEKANFQAVFDDALEGSLGTKQAPKDITENTTVVQADSTFQVVLDNDLDSNFDTNKASIHTQDSLLSTSMQETPVPAPVSDLTNATTKAIIDNNKEVSYDTVADEKANLQDSILPTPLPETAAPAYGNLTNSTTITNNDTNKSTFDDTNAKGLAIKHSVPIVYRYLTNNINNAKSKVTLQFDVYNAITSGVSTKHTLVPIKKILVLAPLTRTAAIAGNLAAKQATENGSEVLANNNAVAKTKAAFQAAFDDSLAAQIGTENLVNETTVAEAEEAFQMAFDNAVGSGLATKQTSGPVSKIQVSTP